MKQIQILLFAICLTSLNIYSQEILDSTILDRDSIYSKHEINVNLIPFITGFDLNKSSAMVQYKYHKRNGAYRISLYLTEKDEEYLNGYDHHLIKYQESGIDTMIISSRYQFVSSAGIINLGYEWHENIGQDWLMFFGLDILGGYGKKVKNEYQSSYAPDSLNILQFNAIKTEVSTSSDASFMRYGGNITAGFRHSINDRFGVSLSIMNNLYYEHMLKNNNNFGSALYFDPLRFFLTGTVMF